MVELNITIDSSQLDAALDNLEVNLQAAESTIGAQIAQISYDTIKEWCPSPTSTKYPTMSTGNLRDSHTLTQISTTQWKIQPTASYAFYVHYGHFFVPPGLAGVDIGKGKPIRSARVWVPPRPWISDALGYLQPQINDIVASLIKNIISGS